MAFNNSPFNFFQGGGGDCDQARKEEEAKRRQLLRKRQVTRNQRGVIGTPPPVKGRKHETIQTEKYLEEVSEMFIFAVDNDNDYDFLY